MFCSWNPGLVMGCVSQGSREKQDREGVCVSPCVYLSREIYFKGLTHVMVELRQVQKMEGGLAGWRLKGELQFKS